MITASTFRCWGTATTAATASASASTTGSSPSRTSFATADSTPLTKRGESSVPNRRASTTASLMITASDRSSASINS
jgi:hypothetical protein